MDGNNGMDLMKQLKLNWWNRKGGINGINETHGIDGMETKKEWSLVYGNHGSDEADRINITEGMMDPLELLEGKVEINGSDGLFGIYGTYIANGIDRIDTLELTELMEFMEWRHGNYGKG